MDDPWCSAAVHRADRRQTTGRSGPSPTEPQPWAGPVYALQGLLYDATSDRAVEVADLVRARSLPGAATTWQNAAAAYAIAALALGVSLAPSAAGGAADLSAACLIGWSDVGRGREAWCFVNDSKATNPASAAPALGAFPPDPDPRIHWIVGGLPKSENLAECVPYFGNVAAAYIIGEAGPMFAELLAPYMPVHRSELIVEAIRQAIAAAQPGDIVMLSPACASFDQFRDYAARGDAFRRIVEALLADETLARGAA